MILKSNDSCLPAHSETADQAATEGSWQQAREAAIYYLSLKKSSSGQVRRYLVRKGWSAPAAAAVTQTLVNDGYINDLLLAQQVLKGRCGSKAESFAHLEQRLKRLGFPSAVRFQALETYRHEGQSDLKLLAAFLKSKYASELRLLRDQELTPAESRELHLLLRRRSASRGFSPAVLRQLLNLWGLTSE
ncbi:hypothetical protein HCH52_02640 [Oscillospiraceae bacterium HV4-5-C5C]|nr:hypothetical protein [Oscillospiraceae bacterium HV4-5-C5C]